MLYINLEINKKKVVALVDTGAQSTIMSQDLCKRCDLFNLCDERYSGIAKGVGTEIDTYIYDSPLFWHEICTCIRKHYDYGRKRHKQRRTRGKD